MKLLTLATSVWFVILVTHSLFCHEIADAIWIMDLAVIAAIALSGVALAVAWMIVAVRTRTRLLSALAATACLVVTVVFAFTPYSDLLGTYFKFYRNMGRYEAIVLQVVESDVSAIEEMAHYPEYVVDKGPPIRVAFIWSGMVDNWIGIVYDPTGEVMRANAFRPDWSNWDDPKLQRVKTLFGGDLFKARRLRKNWYFCRFT